ncbi:hypothetical protein ABEX55_18890 [Priestia endophytica]|uniref:ABC transporter n=1 Tax=Priestia endophytica DSM 13796 TaxID=1121089 RepID=A0A1I5YRW7_9BACI|nr:hypothetical protein [Priestia endophytica]SFQ46981.1 ABC transporter [Priestia endophytica DSM 13796]
MISVNIEKAGYVQNQEIILNVHFTIEKGQLIGLIGSNGAGKVQQLNLSLVHFLS